MNGHFDWREFLILFSSWFICWSFSWYYYSNGTLVGTSGEISFPNISARDLNASLCEFPSVTSGLEGAVYFSA